MNWATLDTFTEYPIKITSHLIQFRDFLNSVWDDVHILLKDRDWKEDPDFIHEWIQANWEFLVERELFGQFEITEGALTPCTLFNTNIRLQNPKAKITHEIFCKPKPGLYLIDKMSQEMLSDELKLIFRAFVKQSPYFELSPPFDCIKVLCVQTKNYHLIPIDQVEFFLAPVSFSTVSIFS